MLAADTQEYDLSTPHPQWAEQHPDTDWWQAAPAGGSRRSQKSGRGRKTDRRGRTDRADARLRFSWTPPGRRCGPPCSGATPAPARSARKSRRLSAAKRNCTPPSGSPVFTSFTAPKILWVRKNEPQVYEKIAKILLPKDYIRYKTDRGICYRSLGCVGERSLLDVRKRDWSGEMLSALSIPREWLPSVYESPEVTGTITPEAAALTGLLAGTPVCRRRRRSGGGSGRLRDCQYGGGLSVTGNIRRCFRSSGRGAIRPGCDPNVLPCGSRQMALDGLRDFGGGPFRVVQGHVRAER